MDNENKVGVFLVGIVAMVAVIGLIVTIAPGMGNSSDDAIAGQAVRFEKLADGVSVGEKVDSGMDSVIDKSKFEDPTEGVVESSLNDPTDRYFIDYRNGWFTVEDKNTFKEVGRARTKEEAIQIRENEKKKSDDAENVEEELDDNSEESEESDTGDPDSSGVHAGDCPEGQIC